MNELSLNLKNIIIFKRHFRWISEERVQLFVGYNSIPLATYLLPQEIVVMEPHGKIGNNQSISWAFVDYIH